MEWVETTGRTIEEALDAALDELGVDENDVEYEVVARPWGGLFGRFGGAATIRARVKPISREKPGEPRRRSRRRGGSGAREDERAGDGRARSGARPGTRGEGTQESRGPRPARNRRRRGRGGTGGRSEGRREEQERGATVDEQADISVDEQADQAVEFTRGLVEAFGAKAEVASHLEDEDTVLVDVTGDNLGSWWGRAGRRSPRSRSWCGPWSSARPGAMAFGSTSTSAAIGRSGGRRCRSSRASSQSEFATRTASRRTSRLGIGRAAMMYRDK